MSILEFFGLMKRSEHEAVAKANNGLLRDLVAERQKFKRAVSDIAYQSDVIEGLRPDAEAMRRKRKRDRDTKAAKRSAG